jgi:hypothetical protein
MFVYVAVRSLFQLFNQFTDFYEISYEICYSRSDQRLTSNIPQSAIWTCPTPDFLRRERH